MVVRLIAAFLFLAIPVWAHAETADRESIEELMRLTGADNLGEQMMEQIIPLMRKAIPDAPDAFWDEFRAEADVNDLMNSIIPIYQKHLTKADVAALVSFYKSPIGQKMIALQPVLMRESVQVGNAWGQAAAQRAMQNLKREEEEKSRP